MIVSRKVI